MMFCIRRLFAIGKTQAALPEAKPYVPGQFFVHSSLGTLLQSIRPSSRFITSPSTNLLKLAELATPHPLFACPRIALLIFFFFQKRLSWHCCDGVGRHCVHIPSYPPNNVAAAKQTAPHPQQQVCVCVCVRVCVYVCVCVCVLSFAPSTWLLFAPFLSPPLPMPS